MTYEQLMLLHPWQIVKISNDFAVKDSMTVMDQRIRSCSCDVSPERPGYLEQSRFRVTVFRSAELEHHKAFRIWAGYDKRLAVGNNVISANDYATIDHHMKTTFPFQPFQSGGHESWDFFYSDHGDCVLHMMVTFYWLVRFLRTGGT